MRVALVFSATVLVPLSTGARADSFALVRDGRPVATIVLAAEPSAAADLAATELREHVRKITGALLPIAYDDSPVEGPKILVGESALTRALGLRSMSFGSQEYMVRIRPDTLVLIGRDGAGEAASSVLPAWGEGRFGAGLVFDGQAAALSIPDCGFSDDEGTLEAWMMVPPELRPTAGTILRLDGGNPWTYHIIEREPGTSRISYMTYDGQTVNSVWSAELPPGWHHVMGTHSRATGGVELFIDGRSCGTATFGVTTCAHAVLNIGALADGQRANLFAGGIDEVRVSRSIRPPPPDGGPTEPGEADADTTLLLRCDEGRGLPRDSSGRARVPLALPGPFDDNGTLYATYDFLERFCGVRWYIPSEIGTVCPTSTSLEVSGEDVRRSPDMIHRWITPTALYIPTPSGPVPAEDVALWKLRMRIGGRNFWVCHSFYGYYDRFLTTHPDWFAQGYEGRPPQMCYTNPEFIAQVVQDARDYFDGKGALPGATAVGDVFGLVPMDNMSWCKCDRCQAELNQAEMGNPQFSNGKASEYIFRFVNKVATEVRKTHPDKWIGALAYSDYAYYPEGVELEPNIVVQMCLHTRNWWCPSMERNDLKVLNTWARREGARRPLYLWLYYCFPALQAQYEHHGVFPSFFAHTVVKQMALYHEAGIEGIFMEHSSECEQTHLMDVPDIYVTLKLADDPSLDGDALIDEFFTRFYGAAAEPMRRLYERIEQTYCSPGSYPPEIQSSPAHQHQTEELAWKWLGTSERMAEFGGLLAEAERTAATDVEKQRVGLFRKGIWEHMTEGRRQWVHKTAGAGQ